jgi:hypothetical protein
MKFISSLINRIEIIAFILGFVAGIYMLIFFPGKYFIARNALAIPPEPVEKIISANHLGEVIIETTSNKKFICDLKNEKECWTEIDYEPVVFGKTLCFMEDCSDNHTLQIMKTTAQIHSFGELSTIYSLKDDGIIYVKHTGFPYLPGYMMGVIIGVLCSFIAFIGKYLFLGVISLFQKGLSK